MRNAAQTYRWKFEYPSDSPWRKGGHGNARRGPSALVRTWCAHRPCAAVARGTIAYHVRVPHADGVLERQLAHEQAVHPPEGELEELDTLLLKMGMQRGCAWRPPPPRFRADLAGPAQRSGTGAPAHQRPREHRCARCRNGPRTVDAVDELFEPQNPALNTRLGLRVVVLRAQNTGPRATPIAATEYSVRTPPAAASSRAQRRRPTWMPSNSLDKHQKLSASTVDSTSAENWVGSTSSGSLPSAEGMHRYVDHRSPRSVQPWPHARP